MALKQRLSVILLIFCFALPLLSAVRYVRSGNSGLADGTSWQTAFKSIQPAINASSQGDEIWVAAGTYNETITLNKEIALFGGFAGTETQRSQRDWSVNPTIIDASSAGRVVTMPELSIFQTRVDGFVLRRGSSDYGGAIHTVGGDVAIVNNLITENVAGTVVGGSAIYLDGSSSITVVNPIELFTSAANAFLQESNLTTASIAIYPTNAYSRAIHRCLQVAANITDAAMNNSGDAARFPLIFRPLFTNDNGNIAICGYVQETNAQFTTNRWIDLSISADRNSLTNDVTRLNANVIGQAIVLSAKKGLPNFNELLIDTEAQVMRRLELRKTSVNSAPSETNQMYSLSITNTFGVEAWNSYTQAYSHPIEIRVELAHTAALKDNNGTVIWPSNSEPIQTNHWTNITISAWPRAAFNGVVQASSFVLPVNKRSAFLPLSQYVSNSPRFRTNGTFERFQDFAMPSWHLEQSVRLRYIAIDDNRVIDFVNVGPITTNLNLTARLLGAPEGSLLDPVSVASVWRTNSFGPNVPAGIIQQLDLSLGIEPLDDYTWAVFNASSTQTTKTQMIDYFRVFVGLTPFYAHHTNLSSTNLVAQAPFTAWRKYNHRLSLQVNDPLVHYMAPDLLNAGPASFESASILPPASSPPPSNLAALNIWYQPWGGRRPPGGAAPVENMGGAFDNAAKDTNIRWSDDWQFPSGEMMNLHRLDRVHRGTPWQTIYPRTGALSVFSTLNQLFDRGTYPTNDGRWLDLFTTNRAAFADNFHNLSRIAVVNNTIVRNYRSGVGTKGTITGDGVSALVNNIITQNGSGLSQLPGIDSWLLERNCISGNSLYNYSNVLPGEGDISEDPRLGSDFRLQLNSPCVDAGTESNWVYPLETNRLQGSAVDLGAFETTSASSPIFEVAPASSNQAPTMKLTGFLGETYVIEASEDLLEWNAIQTNVAAPAIVILDNVVSSNRFYRALRRP